MSEEIKLIREEIIIQQKEIEELKNRLAVRGDIIKIFERKIEEQKKEIKEYDYYKAEYERLEDIEEKYDKALKEIEALKHLKGIIRIDNNGKTELLKLTDFISKDKIKAKIKDYQEIKQQIIKDEQELKRKMIAEDIIRNDYCEKMLQELLEE